MKLHIRAQMPLGGSVHELNEKVQILENFLVGFKEIKRFESRVEWWGANLTVEFKDEYRDTSFPYVLESKVIGKVISIGGRIEHLWRERAGFQQFAEPAIPVEPDRDCRVQL